jgi:hypothetical protein
MTQLAALTIEGSRLRALTQAAGRRRLGAVLGMAGAVLALGGCGTSTTTTITARRAMRVTRWTAFARAPKPLDLVGPRPDGGLVLAADARLWLLSGRGSVHSLPGGQGGYRSAGGEEPYIALATSGCFGAGNIYAIRLRSGPGVVVINRISGARRFAAINAPGLIDGITFDHTGTFGRRLLVTITADTTTTVDAIDCHGAVTTITRYGPRVEGGIAVAPATFGRFAGDLIAPDEKSGRTLAITPHGRSMLLANSGLPHGPDTGVESEAFVPAGREDAFVSDRLTPGNAHPGDNLVLRIRHAALAAAGVRTGDLLVAGEGGGLTDAVSCSAAGCHVRLVAKGPPIAHIEGHIAFASLR